MEQRRDEKHVGRQRKGDGEYETEDPFEQYGIKVGPSTGEAVKSMN